MITGKNKRERIQKQSEPKRTYVIRNHNRFSSSGILQKSTGELNWDDYKMNDKERIRYNTEKYKNTSITQAFADTYPEYKILEHGINLATEIIPKEPKSGDIVLATIKNINKDRTVLEVINLKMDVVCVTNLYKYERFRNNDFEGDGLDVQIVDVKDNKLYVDPLAPLFNKWMNKRLATNDQYLITNPIPPITVYNLHQVSPAGFTGKAKIDAIDALIDEPYEIDVFIPSSQMVLNISADLATEYEGKTVEAFVINYSQPTKFRAGSIICSVKDYKRYLGNMELMRMFNEYCENSAEWKKIKKHKYHGFVTGIINSSKKCGIFVEIPEKNITGMVYLPADELVNYKPFDEVTIHIKEFEEDTIWNASVDQMQHREPFIIEDDCLIDATIKPVFEFIKK